MYVYIFMHNIYIYLCIYVYIQREAARQRGSEREMEPNQRGRRIYKSYIDYTKNILKKG